jgi:signal transduction histidine kinase
VDLRPADDPEGWLLVASDGIDRYVISRQSTIINSRIGLPLAISALVLALLGLLASATRRRRADVLASISVVIAWLSFAIVHDITWEPVIGAIAAIGLLYWFLVWDSHRIVQAAAVIAGVGILAIWLVARWSGDEAVLNWSDLARFWMAPALLAGVLAVAIGPTIRRGARRLTRFGAFDLGLAAAGLALIAVVGVTTHLALALSLVVLVAFGVVSLKGRQWLRDVIDSALFADSRQRSSIAAAEAERARLSRELHDDPLQALAGVIQSLESQPSARGEREKLRTVAAQLRSLATNLRPPILDDLGLVPAIESLFAEPGEIGIAVQIENDVGFLAADRPPRDVELGVYRIVQEATSNAIRHADCHHLVIRGEVRTSEVSIDVIDDGRGISESLIEEAMRAGHIGISSMRRRAEAMDAQISVRSDSDRGGTIVSLRWLA